MKVDKVALILQRYNLLTLLSTTRQKRQVGGRGLYYCPFHSHEYKTPSLSVEFYKGVWNCFSCRKRGGVIDWLGYSEFGESWDRHDKRKFRELLDRVLGIPADQVPTPIELPPLTDTHEVKHIEYHDLEGWRSNLFDLIAQRGLLDWLYERGIKKEWAEYHYLGYTGRDPNLPAWARQRLAIPWIIGGEVVGYKLRVDPRKVETTTLKYAALPGSNFRDYLYNQDCVTLRSRTRFLLETELDGIAVNSYRDEDCSLAKPAGSFEPIHTLCLLGKKTVHIPDNDKAGIAQAKQVKSLMPRVITAFPPQMYKDLGVCFQNKIIMPVLDTDLIRVAI